MENNLRVLIEPEPKSLEPKSSNICPDYDDECVDVLDPLYCWMGTKNCDRAKGLCPLIHTEN
jgi:hypothetical protein